MCEIFLKIGFLLNGFKRRGVFFGVEVDVFFCFFVFGFLLRLRVRRISFFCSLGWWFRVCFFLNVYLDDFWLFVSFVKVIVCLGFFVDFVILVVVLDLLVFVTSWVVRLRGDRGSLVFVDGE